MIQTNHASVNDNFQEFRTLNQRGHWLIPIARGTKAPQIKGWQHLRIGPEDFDRYFSEPCNAGVLLGLADAEGYVLVDIDLDLPQAVELADQHLPPTQFRFGRESKPNSHRFYRVRGDVKGKPYKGADGNTIVEIRGAGQQTVVPGSKHPTGECVRWDENGAAAIVELADLTASVAKLAAACGWQPPPMADAQPKAAAAADWVSRCKRYLEKTPDSISGQGGHDAVLRACCEAFRFGLSDAEARDIATWYNANKCNPPWNEREIEHKLADAKQKVSGAAEFGIRQRQGVTPDWVPSPIDCFPREIAELAKAYAEDTGIDSTAVAIALTAVAGSAIGNSRSGKPKERYGGSGGVPPSIWFMLVMPSGAMKTPLLDFAASFLKPKDKELRDKHKREMLDYEARHDAYIAAQKSRKASEAGEKMQKPKPPPAGQLIMANTTFEAMAEVLNDNPRGVLMHVDEGAGWISDFDRYTNRSSVSSWLEMFNANHITINRKTGENKRVYIERAVVGLIGGIQPGALKRHFTPEFLENGFLARLILVMPPVKAKVWSDSTIPPEAMCRMQELIDGLWALEGGPIIDRTTGEETGTSPRVLQFDDAAKKKWVAFANAHNAELHNLTDDELRAAYAKIENYAVRFALIFELCRNRDAATIGAESVGNAIQLANWCTGEACRVYAAMRGKPAADSFEADADRIRRWLAREGKPSITPRDFSRIARRFKTCEEAELRLRNLAKEGYGVFSEAMTEKGRPTTCFTPHEKRGSATK